MRGTLQKVQNESARALQRSARMRGILWPVLRAIINARGKAGTKEKVPFIPVYYKTKKRRNRCESKRGTQTRLFLENRAVLKDPPDVCPPRGKVVTPFLRRVYMLLLYSFPLPEEERKRAREGERERIERGGERFIYLFIYYALVIRLGQI